MLDHLHSSLMDLYGKSLFTGNIIVTGITEKRPRCARVIQQKVGDAKYWRSQPVSDPGHDLAPKHKIHLHWTGGRGLERVLMPSAVI